MSLLRISLLIGLAAAMVLAAPNGRSRGRERIEEILARAGNFKDEKFNRRGRYRNGRKPGKDAGEEIVELDIARTVPIPVEGSGRVVPSRSGGSGGRTNRNSRGMRRGGRVGRGRRNKRNALSSSSRYWKDGRVPYVYDGSITSATKTKFQEAINEFNDHTCVKWIPRTSEKDYVRVTDGGSGSGCFAYIGVVGNDQVLNLNQPNCVTKSVIVHEMMHALGVYHQHTRPDRDDYVEILTQNIQPNALSNFNKQTDAALFGTPYDYRSVMHYGKWTFAISGKIAINPKDPDYLNIIGAAPTLGFRDIELLNKMYKCADSCPQKTCPDGGFLGHDCKCKCETSKGDYNNPTENCAEVCTLGNACNCGSWSGACGELPNTHCDTSSQECKCDTGHVIHDGVCTLLSSITCSSINEDCKCSLKSGGCNGLSNTVCQSSSDMCVCASGFIESNGKCVSENSVSCDAADKICGCKSKGSSACSGVPNSSCDSETDSCICDVDYYNMNGDCTKAPTCLAMNKQCHCEVQGASACAAVSNTECNVDTGACECPPIYIEQSGQCFKVHASDGSAIAPFKHGNGNIKWKPTAATSASPDNGAFGIPANDFYLLADGSSNDKAVLETSLITRNAGETICVKGGVYLNNAKFTVKQIIGSRSSWWYVPYAGDLGYYYEFTVRFDALSSTTDVKFSLEGETAGSGDWLLKLDPIKIGAC